MASSGSGNACSAPLRSPSSSGGCSISCLTRFATSPSAPACTSTRIDTSFSDSAPVMRSKMVGMGSFQPDTDVDGLAGVPPRATNLLDQAEAIHGGSGQRELAGDLEPHLPADSGGCSECAAQRLNLRELV